MSHQYFSSTKIHARNFGSDLSEKSGVPTFLTLMYTAAYLGALSLLLLCDILGVFLTH